VDSSGFLQGGEDGGQFAAGCASAPLDVNRSVQSATAAALRAIRVVRQAARPEKAHA
jgi:quinone-modifying oxidoreductase subunit QmoA